jgi:ATP-dependent DNA helicase DinG
MPDTRQEILPNHSCAVFDEAHTLEDVASECMGLSVSRRSLTYTLQRIFGSEKIGGLLQRFQSSKLAEAAAGLYSAVESFFDSVREWLLHSAPKNLRIREPLPVNDDFPNRLMAFGVELMQSSRDVDDEDLSFEINGRGTELVECAEAALIIKNLTLDGHAYWVEKGKNDICLRSAPVRVSGLLPQTLFTQVPTAILTGATLAVGNEFTFLRKRLGLDLAREQHLGSPFDYARQATIYIEKENPPPDSELYMPAVCQALKHYLKESLGRALVLFTSFDVMRAVSDQLTSFLEEHGWRVLIQGSGLSRTKLLDIFKCETDSVLFGTSSFWQGVNVPGEALSSVIITHLPFAVPTLPMQQARSEDLKARGEDAFRNYSLPQAVIRLKQGVGRLIRSKTDKGSIVLLDSRVLTKWYGRIFLESLPPCKILIND